MRKEPLPVESRVKVKALRPRSAEGDHGPMSPVPGQEPTMPVISHKRTQRIVRLALSCIIALLMAAPSAAQLRLDPYLSGLALPGGFVQDPTNPAVQYV